MINQKRILLQTLVLLGTFWIAPALFAQLQPQQPQQLPQIPLSPMSQPPQILQQHSTPNQIQQEAGAMSLSLTRIQPDGLVQALRQVCGHRFVAQSQYQFLFSSNRNNVIQQSLLLIDPQANRAVLSGDRQLAEQVYYLIAAIDLPPPPGRERKLYPLQQTTPPDVLIRALDSYRLQRPIAQRQSGETSGDIQQVQFQDGGFDPGIGGQGMFMPGAGMQGFFQSGDPSQIGIVDDFTYRIVDGLDVLIIEAEGGRLAQFIEMIRKLEELSRINRPKVEVVYLKHQNNVSLGALLSNTDLYNAIFGMVQGRALIIPMTSPNGVLLIGWGDAMDVAREFIASLDFPTTVENSLLHFFKLAHISATQARATIQGTFPPPPLRDSGYAERLRIFIDQRTNILIVQGGPDELEQVARLIKEIDVPDAAPTLELRHFRVKHSLAPDMAQTLQQAITNSTTDGKSPALELRIQSEEGQRIFRSGILSDVLITSDVRNNIIFVRAPEACMEFLEELINILDTANPEAVIKVFQIENGDAGTLSQMLEALLPSNVTGLAGPQLPGTDQGEALIPLRFVVDPRTNSIIAAGSAGDLMVVEALLNTLDQEDMLSRKVKVHFLKNQKAGPVANTIQNYVTNVLQVQAASPGVISNYQQIETAVIVVADADSNSLIISATPKHFDQIMELIEEIDSSPAQVVINVLIAEVTLSEDKEWAAELGLQDPLFIGRGGNMNFNNLNPLPSGNGTQPGSVASQMLTNFPGAVGRVGGGLVFSASSDYLNIMLRALQTNNRLEVLSSPQITTMNNTQAVLSVGQTIPQVVGGTTNQYGQIDYRYNYVPVNLMLTITPTISPEGTVVMSIVIVKDKVGVEMKNGDQVANAIDTSQLGSIISAADNQTVVLGGLITREETKDIKKVPLLGDIPLLGKFFRHELNKTVRKELLVILTPRIINNRDDLDHVRQAELARMSWCLSNVVETHGDVGAYSVVSPRPYTGNAPVVTPGPVKMETLQPMLAPTLPAPVLPRRN